MAKKRSSRRSASVRSGSRRDYSIANPIPSMLPRLPRPDLLIRSYLVKQSGEDFRRPHPRGKSRSLRSLSGRIVRPRPHVRPRVRLHRDARTRRFVPAVVDLFVEHRLPRDAVICARRNIRKEVLHALGKAGRGGQRPPRRTANSDIHCDRR